MKTYSLDLRQRTLAVALRGNRIIPEVGELSGVSVISVNKVLRLRRADEDLSRTACMGCHVLRLRARHHTLLRAAIAAEMAPRSAKRASISKRGRAPWWVRRPPSRR